MKGKGEVWIYNSFKKWWILDAKVHVNMSLTWIFFYEKEGKGYLHIMKKRRILFMAAAVAMLAGCQKNPDSSTVALETSNSKIWSSIPKVLKYSLTLSIDMVLTLLKNDMSGV